MINNDLKEISKKFLELRKKSWKNLANQKNNIDSTELVESNSLQENYKRELNLFLDKHLQEKLESEKDYLLAKFIMFFGSANLKKEKFLSIQKQFSEKVEEFPILALLDQSIAVFRKHLFDFFISYGENYQKDSEKFFVNKTKNEIADLIIDTEIRRTMTDYHDRPSLVNSSNDFRIDLNELDDKYEVVLKKIKTSI
jgi:hypothetical protein